MSEIITLYHGSVFEFDEIDVAKGKPFKDFGVGFYTSQNRGHAEMLALRNRYIEISRRKRFNNPIVVKPLLYIYQFDTAELERVNVKRFATAGKEWLRFVVLNRTTVNPPHDYDVVIGPTVNDNTRASLDSYFAGAYGDVRSESAMDILLQVLQPEKLPEQYFFGSGRAAASLMFRKREVIES
ncbi:MAG: DUF3990 domain-containing protein [Planctomycetaceae bacterium]|jgi:hypothetical protein|nr:DUF3990 domain-containing protein [Planctomycetaceae bacterium]